MVRYGIVGSGNIGSAVAGHFARTGIDVHVAASRGAKAVSPLVDKLGPHVVPSETADVLQADTVILAVPFDAVERLVDQVTDWNQRVIIDATNAIDYTNFSPAELGVRASSDLVEQWASNSRVVKAFGHTWAKVLAREPGDGHGGRRVSVRIGQPSERQRRRRRTHRAVRLHRHRPRPQRPRRPVAAVRRPTDDPQLHLPGHRWCHARRDGPGSRLTPHLRASRHAIRHDLRRSRDSRQGLVLMTTHHLQSRMASVIGRLRSAVRGPHWMIDTVVPHALLKEFHW